MSGCFLFKVPGNPDSVASSVNEKGLPERQSFFHFEISSGLDSHWDEPLQEKQLQSRARSSAKTPQKKKADSGVSFIFEVSSGLKVLHFRNQQFSKLHRINNFLSLRSH
jgi:hypothetical protein